MPNEGSFGSKLRAARDKGRPPREVWQFRHGHTFMGVTLHVWAVGPLEAFAFEDLAWSLLAAAADPAATDLQLHFAKSSGGLGQRGVEAKLEGLVTQLVREEFAPLSFTAKMRNDGTGWLRIPLFAPEDLPETPFPKEMPVGHA
ncbi:MAG: hypothetical protein HYS74_01505 [Parcubacteria group bacterium]|nr:hypothetical protein [Parcubacteria group bacterium]